MSVSGGESVCAPPAPAPIRAAGKRGGAQHCGRVGGGGGLVLLQRGEQKGLFAFSPPEGVPHPQQRPPHPGSMLDSVTHLGPAAPGEERPCLGGRGHWGGPGLGGQPRPRRLAGLRGEWRQ